MYSIRFSSDGTKRILSTAIALIGEPAVVLLDEPVVGLDPVSKARVWETLNDSVCSENIAIIITSRR